MVVRITKPSRNRDWKKVVESLGLAGLSMSGINLAGTYQALKTAIAESEPSHSTDERAWVWLRVSLTVAVHDLLRDTVPEEAERRRIARDFLEDALVLRGIEVVEAGMLVDPGASPILASVVAAAAALVPDAGIARFRRILRGISARVYALDIDYYRPVAEAVLGPFAEGERRDFAWARHEDWIRGLFERDPIFSPDEAETTPLAAVYHRLRCFWHEAAPGRTERSARVGDLHDTLRDWLADRGTGDIRVVAGGPGSGKSSFARAFATEVIAAGHHRVIYVQLQHFGLGDHLHGRIGDYLTQRNTAIDPRGSAGFPENPLDWRAEDPTPLLLVFDGLDELSPDDDKARDLSRKFVFAVRNLLTSLNASGPEVRALVAGRSAACQDAMREADLESRALIHVAPLIPLTGPEAHPIGRVTAVHDPAGLANRDERPDFWRRSACRDMEMPEAVQAAELRELNAEPLLLRLLLLSGFAGAGWQTAAENRNLVYEAIFSRIFERNLRKRHVAAHGLDEAAFFTLLECLGLAAWRGNGRTGSEADFARLRDLHATAAQRTAFQSLDAAELRSVAIQFYTRRDLEGSGFEFIHKSFGEYLAARGLLAFGLDSADWIEDPRHPPKPEEAARRWVELTGKAELSDEIIRFLIDEARRLPEAEAKTALGTLTGLFNWCLREGMPAHKVTPDLGFRDLETSQRCAETALLAVMEALHRRSGATVAMRWPETHMPHLDLLNRLRATIAHPSRMLLGCLDFSGADLSYAFLAQASLRRGRLRGANLFRAEMDRADLGEADLSGASLLAVNLDESDLSRADLSGAKLVDASLIGTRLRGAKLAGADLTGSDLSAADLVDADLAGCRLDHADLEAALHLTQAQIDAALGDPGTRLPEGLRRPDHWEE